LRVAGLNAPIPIPRRRALGPITLKKATIQPIYV
jgi:hypothetical protein